MLLRIWRARFDPERLDELNDFARTRSTPMFDSFPGCMGHLFAHRDDTYWAVSMWVGHFHISHAEGSDVYRETAEALEATGILRGEPAIEVLDIDALNLGWQSRRPDDDDEYDD